MRVLSLMRKYKNCCQKGWPQCATMSQVNYFSHFYPAEKRRLTENDTEPQTIELRGHLSSLQDGNIVHCIVPYSQKLLHGFCRLKGCIVFCAHSSRSPQTAQICSERPSLWVECPAQWPCFGTLTVHKTHKTSLCQSESERAHFNHISWRLLAERRHRTRVYGQHYRQIDCCTAVRFYCASQKVSAQTFDEESVFGSHHWLWINDSCTHTWKGRKPQKVFHTAAVQKYNYGERSCTNHWQDSSKFCCSQVWAIILLTPWKWQD